MLREARVKEWTGKKIGEIDNIVELDGKANDYLDRLIRDRDDNDDKKRRVEKIIETLEQIEDEDRPTKNLYRKTRLDRKRERIEALAEKTVDRKTGEERKEIRHDLEDMKRIARETPHPTTKSRNRTGLAMNKSMRALQREIRHLHSMEKLEHELQAKHRLTSHELRQLKR